MINVEDIADKEFELRAQLQLLIDKAFSSGELAVLNRVLRALCKSPRGVFKANIAFREKVAFFIVLLNRFI